MRDLRRTARILACLAALMAAGCGGGGGDAAQADGIVHFSPTIDIPATAEIAYLLFGQGLGSNGDPVTVRFEAVTGTPFDGGTSAVHTTGGHVESFGRMIRGLMPPPGVPATEPAVVEAYVSVELQDGTVYTSPTPWAHFAPAPPPPPTIASVSTGPLLSGFPACFTIAGTGFGAAGGTATVAFRGSAGGTFLGGTTPTLTVVATVDSPTQLSGVIPPNAVSGPVSASIHVTLPDAREGDSSGPVAAFDAEQKVLSLDPAGFDFVGEAVAIDGSTAVAGARLEDDMGSQAGAAYVFTKTAGVWAASAKLLAADGGAGDNFGFDVAVSGGTIVVGAPLHDTPSANAGAVYVFTGGGATWAPQQKLSASDAASGDRFGWAVSIDGDTLAGGAPLENNAGGIDAGSVYVFTRTGTVWTEEAKLLAADGAAGDELGVAVDIHGDVLAAGAPGKGGNTGAVYAYRRAAGTWDAGQTIARAGGAGGDVFGFSVAVTTDRIAIGEPGAPPGAGAAHVYRWTGTGWLFEDTVQPAGLAAGDRFGWSVDIADDLLAVGAPLHDAAASNAGAVWCYERVGFAWGTTGVQLATDAASSDQFGFDVALTPCDAIVGSPLDNNVATDAGSVYFK